MLSADGPRAAPQLAARAQHIFDIRAAAGFRPKAPRDDLPEMVPVDCGEDAFYIKHHRGYASLGLSDGVGGWGQLGVDSSLFAWDLMHQCEDVFTGAAAAHPGAPPSPQFILERGYMLVVDRGVVTAGSSTACVVVFEKEQGMLLTTNLGDSGLMVFRKTEPRPPSMCGPPPGLVEPRGASADAAPVSNGNAEKDANAENATTEPDPETTGAPEETADPEIYDALNDEEEYLLTLPYRPIFSTTERQHYFNAPYQLSVLPPSMAHNPSNITDSPADAIQSNAPLANGDVIVMASDGLWDNMYWEEVVQLLDQELGHVRDLVERILAAFERRQRDGVAAGPAKTDAAPRAAARPAATPAPVQTEDAYRSPQDSPVPQGDAPADELPTVGASPTSAASPDKLESAAPPKADAASNDTDQPAEGRTETAAATLPTPRPSPSTTPHPPESDGEADARQSLAKMTGTASDEAPASIPNREDDAVEAHPSPLKEEEYTSAAASSPSGSVDAYDSSFDDGDVDPSAMYFEPLSPFGDHDSGDFVGARPSGPANLDELTDPDELLALLDERVERCVAALTSQAAAHARNTLRVSPFAKSARMNGKAFVGGKVDDITIIVGVIVKLPTFAAASAPLG